MIRKKLFCITFAFLFLMFFVSPVLGFEFYGYTKYANSTAMNATNITVNAYTFGPTGPILASSNTTQSNAFGWFNVSGIPENDTWFYKPIIAHYNDSNYNYVDYVGASIPEFPYGELSNISPATFYLKSGITINISAVNATGQAKPFTYQVKDKALGYPISENFTGFNTIVLVSVPSDRNYSVMIYPNESFPVTHDISSPSGNYYNKTFNTTESNIRINGTINATGVDDIKVFLLLLEPGRMLYFGDNAPLLFNFSGNDDYNTTDGVYNISAIGPYENSSAILFAFVNNTTAYYGGYKEVSLNYSTNVVDENISVYPLLGSDRNVSTTTGGGNQNITIKQYKFNLLNESNISLTEFAHVEVEVDYDDYNMTNLTFMVPVSQTSNGSFYVPLINVTGIKRMNIFASQAAPTKKTFTQAQLAAASEINITMKEAFNMEDPDGQSLGDLYIDMVVHNSTCNVPNYHVSCSFFGGVSGKSSIHPLTVVISGAPLGFMMRNANNITVHYINVDLLASGPPDAMFDSDSSDTTGTSTFEQAWKFGSTGPEIYDYVIVGVPYTQGTATVTGFDETEAISIDIDYLYDENFDAMWTRGTDAVAEINTNDTLIDFRDYIGTSYENYLNGTGVTCSATDSTLSTAFCYKDTTNNMLWFKIPHFSGIGPQPSGTLFTSTSSSPGGGSIGGSSSVIEYTVLDSQFEEGYQRQIKSGDGMKFNISEVYHRVKIDEIAATWVRINVTSELQQETLIVGETKKFDTNDDNYYDLSVTLDDIFISEVPVLIPDKATLTVLGIYEKSPGVGETATPTGEAGEVADTGEVGEAEIEPVTYDDLQYLVWPVIGIIVVVLLWFGWSKSKAKK